MTLGTRLVLLALVPFLAVVAGPPAAAQAPEVAGRLVSVQGTVQVERAGRTQAAAARQELLVGDLVRTGPASRAGILLADETSVRLNADSTLRLKAVGGRPAGRVTPAATRAAKTLMEMVVGDGFVRSQAPPGGLDIETTSATASIRGTELVVSVRADGEARVVVLEGVVAYGNALATVTLARGDLGVARPGQPPERRTLVEPENAVQWIFTYPASLGPADYGEAAADPGAAPGWTALAEGRVDDALARFRAVSPPTPASLLGIAAALTRRGDLPGAGAAVDEALRAGGRRPLFLAQRALQDLLAGDAARARAALDEALRVDPGAAPALALRSLIAVVQNRRADALADAREAVARDPRSPAGQRALALALQADFQLEEALRAAREAAALDPRDAAAHVQVARLLFGAGRVHEALAAARRARALDPASPEALATLGFVVLGRGDTAEARDLFLEAIARGTASGEPYVGFGLAAFRLGSPVEGLEALLTAVALEPRVSLYWSYLAKGLYQVGRHVEAQAALDRAAALDPRDPTPELYRGVVLRDLNRPAEAIAAFQRSVALNDHRAVYRSRLLLDRDLAARNVNLALAYLALGQTDRALAAGIRALHEDPQSSSAHLFYGSVVGLGQGAFGPGLSELLQYRILSPVNQNAFNTFNDYTMLLEQPRLQATLGASGGTQGTFASALSITGGAARIAGEQFASFSRTDGVKDRNGDDESWTAATFLKLALTPRSSAYLQLFHQESKGGDIFADQEHFTANDEDLRRNASTTFLELGYQIQPQPESQLLVYVQGQLQRFGIEDRTLVVTAGPPAVPGSTLRTDQRTRLVSRQPFYDGQVAYLHRLGDHHVWLAADYYGGEPDTRVRAVAVTDLLLAGVPVASATGSVDRLQRFHQEFLTLVAQDTWEVRRGLYLTGGLRFTHARDGDPFSHLRHDTDTLSPQAGLLWRLTPAHTLRLAAFESVQTPPHTVLSPTQIAGFFVDAPLASSTRTRQYHAAWDADLTPTTFLTVGGFRREAESPRYVTRPDGVRERETIDRVRTGLSAALNQILGRYFGVSLAYLRVHREGPGEPDGTDDLVRLGVNFVHPTGLSALASVAWVRQDLGRGAPPNAPADFWVGSVGAGYEFPDKRGAFSVTVENPLRQRFDLHRIPGVRSDLVVPERPEVRVLATLRLNF